MLLSRVAYGLRTLAGAVIVCCSMLMPSAAMAQVPDKQWDRTFGGLGYEDLRCVRPTSDGGYILGGLSTSAAGGDKTQASRGADYWLVKLDASGNKQWDRTFGGDESEDLLSVEQTRDGGYVLGGTSNSGISGNKTAPNLGPILSSDYWVVKIDASGATQWDRTFGGSELEEFGDLRQTQDGGFLLGGTSNSGISGNKTQPNHSLPGAFNAPDYWIVKLDANGNKQWDRVLGGQHNEELTSVQQTADGGYVLGGFSDSDATGDKTEPNRGPSTPFRSADYWVVKTDASGTKQWDRTLGGDGDDRMQALQQTTDGGFLVGGFSFSGISGNKTQPTQGQADYWIVKLNPAGTQQWDRTLGGGQTDALSSLRQTTDGGYVLGGTSNSDVTGDRTKPNRSPNGDYWLVKLDTGGSKQWDLAYGGDSGDALHSVRQTRDGGYLLGGTSYSGLSGDKTEPNHGSTNTSDFWVVKLSGPPTVRISGDSLLCSGGQAQLLATASPATATFRWSTGAVTSAITVAQPGTYTVVASFAGGGTGTAQYVVQAFTPSATVFGDSVVCPGRPATLTAVAPSAVRYLWSTGATTPTIAATQAGTYAVRAFFASGCSRDAQLRVRSAPVPVSFSLGSDTTLCENDALVLRGPVGASLRYQWSDGSTGPSLLVRQAGTYTLQTSSLCGSQTATRRVSTRPCLLVPDVITPNGDLRNDRFAIHGLIGNDWMLDIYSRWGARVYTTQAYQNDWGDIAPPGTYYYFLRRAATSTVYKGWLEVIR